MRELHQHYSNNPSNLLGHDWLSCQQSSERLASCPGGSLARGVGPVYCRSLCTAHAGSIEWVPGRVGAAWGKKAAPLFKVLC